MRATWETRRERGEGVDTFEEQRGAIQLLLLLLLQPLPLLARCWQRRGQCGTGLSTRCWHNGAAAVARSVVLAIIAWDRDGVCRGEGLWVSYKEQKRVARRLN